VHADGLGDLGDGVRRTVAACRAFSLGLRPPVRPRARQMYAETDETGKRRHTVADIAAELGVSRPIIYRALEPEAESS